MKIIITESQYNMLLESTDYFNIVEQILEMENVKVYYGYNNLMMLMSHLSFQMVIHMKEPLVLKQ